MDNKIRWLRISYWVGVIVDGLVGLEMLFPDLIPLRDAIDFIPGAEYRFALGWGTALMFGWTALLYWASRKPVERKGVLLLTVFPVISGLMINNLAAIQAGISSWSRMLPTLIFQVILIALFAFSYWNARDVKIVT